MIILSNKKPRVHKVQIKGFLFPPFLKLKFELKIILIKRLPAIRAAGAMPVRLQDGQWAP